jgi:hypothetical protein
MRNRYLFKWLQGYNAFEDEISFERNPYAHEWDADAWAEGWLNAWANGWLAARDDRAQWLVGEITLRQGIRVVHDSGYVSRYSDKNNLRPRV